VTSDGNSTSTTGEGKTLKISNNQMPGKGSVDCYGSSKEEPALFAATLGQWTSMPNAEVAAILTAVATQQAVAGMLISYN